jgi:hypothetical protein
VEEITLTVSQIPAHSHPFLASVDPGTGWHDLALPFRSTQCKHEPRRDRTRWGKPASYELPAVPLRRLHHLVIRDLPVAHLGESHGSFCC